MTKINTNVNSLVAQSALAANSKNLATAMERLSTGTRINSARDDAAGLAISSRMESQVRGLNAAIRNASDGISMAQTAEGAMEEISSMLQRMRELAIQSASDTNSAKDRQYLDSEVQQLKAEIDRVVSTTTFNGKRVLDGSLSANLQVGANAVESMNVSVADLSTLSLGAISGAASASAVTSAVFNGVQATPTTTQMSFSGNGTYNFVLEVGLNSEQVTSGTKDVAIYNISADVLNGSAEDIVDKINAAIRGKSSNTVTSGANAGALYLEAADSIRATYSGTTVSIENLAGGAIKLYAGTASAYATGAATITSGSKLSASGNTATITSLVGGSGSENLVLGDSAVATKVHKNNGETRTTTAVASKTTLTLAGTGAANDVFALVLKKGATTTTLTTAALSAAGTATTIADALKADTDFAASGYAIAVVAGKIEVSRADGATFTIDASPITNTSTPGTQTLTADDSNTTELIAATTAVSIANGTPAVNLGSSVLLDFVGQDTYTLKFNQNETGTAASTQTSGVTFNYDGTAASLNNAAIAIKAELGTLANITSGTAFDWDVTVVGTQIKITDKAGNKFQISDFASTGGGRVVAANSSGQTATGATATNLLDDTVFKTTALTAAKGLPKVTDVDLTFTASDTYSFTITDGTATAVVKDIKYAPGTATDTSMKTAIETALARAGMNNVLKLSAPATLDGNYTLVHSLGREIKIENFASDAGGVLKVVKGSTETTGADRFLDDTVSGTPVVVRGIDVLTSNKASAAITTLDAALEDVTSERAKLGAVQSRLDHAINNLTNISTNTSASRSRIMDADYGTESANLAKAQIIQQAATAMLAQANQSSQSVLSLLQ